MNNQAVEAAQAGRFEDAIGLLRQARRLAPADHAFARNLSGILTDWAAQMEPGQLETATEALEEAVALDPANGYAPMRLGELAFAARGDLTRAIELWTRAAPLLDGPARHALIARIAQAERDAAIERSFPALSTAHFHIRFEDASYAAQAAALGDALEQAYTRLAGALEVSIASVPVLVYAGGSFERVIGRRDWALGLYDGRIRLRLEDLGSDVGAAILSHELAHAFLARAFGASIPTWVHEGFAQTQEPPLPPNGRQEELRAALLARTAWVPLKWLDRRFTQPSGFEDVERAYAESRLVLERLIERHGLPRLARFFRRLSQGEPVESAFDAAFAPQRWARVDHGNLD